MKWTYPNKKGLSPSCRIKHSMNYLKLYNYLIIHAGYCPIKYRALNDLFVLDLNLFEWYIVLYNFFDLYKG